MLVLVLCTPHSHKAAAHATCRSLEHDWWITRQVSRRQVLVMALCKTQCTHAELLLEQPATQKNHDWLIAREAKQCTSSGMYLVLALRTLPQLQQGYC